MGWEQKYISEASAPVKERANVSTSCKVTTNSAPKWHAVAEQKHPLCCI